MKSCVCVPVIVCFSLFDLSVSFQTAPSLAVQQTGASRSGLSPRRSLLPRRSASTVDSKDDKNQDVPIWETIAEVFVSEGFRSNPEEMKSFINYVTFFKVGIPSLVTGAIAGALYPPTSMWVADLINDPRTFDVIANDYSQYIQNILTTCGLMFSILTGYTYYFLYQQQEAIYHALFEEVTVAKSLLEQVALVSQGRTDMYKAIITCIDRYVDEDLIRFDIEPSVLLSKRPVDDPLEEIMFLTSVGEPSIIYATVKSLRQARAFRLGALQRKLPPIHSVLLCSLAIAVLFTFPFLGAGSQTIGGENILKVQACYISIIVFGITMVLGVLNELNDRAGQGAYNVESVLSVMVSGLQEELDGRLKGKYISNIKSPTIDGMFRAPSDDSMMPSDLLLQHTLDFNTALDTVPIEDERVPAGSEETIEDTKTDDSKKSRSGSRISKIFKRVRGLRRRKKNETM